MKVFNATQPSAVAVLALSMLTMTGCHSTRETSRSETTASSRAYEPSDGGAGVAAERPGAGVGAQRGMGAAADVPEATQKGAGASNLSPKLRDDQQRAGGASSTTVTDATTLTTNPDPLSLSGRPVRLSGMTVQEVIGDRVLVLSAPQGGTFNVLSQSPLPEVQPSDTVSVSGTINPVPTSPGSLGLSPQASQALQRQPIYINAQQVQVANQ